MTTKTKFFSSPVTFSFLDLTGRREKKGLILFLDGGEGEEGEEEGSCGFGFEFLLDSFNFVK